MIERKMLTFSCKVNSHSEIRKKGCSILCNAIETQKRRADNAFYDLKTKYLKKTEISHYFITTAGYNVQRMSKILFPNNK